MWNINSSTLFTLVSVMGHALANGMFAHLVWAEAWKGLACLVWPLGGCSQNKRPRKLTWTQTTQSLKQSCFSQPGSEKNKCLQFVASEIWGCLYAPLLQQWQTYHRCLRRSLEGEVKVWRVTGLFTKSAAPPRNSLSLQVPIPAQLLPMTSYYYLPRVLHYPWWFHYILSTPL